MRAYTPITSDDVVRPASPRQPQQHAVASEAARRPRAPPTRKRANLDDYMVELCLFISINEHEIPALDTIAPLATHIKLATALPDRFKNHQYKAVLELSSTVLDDDDDIDLFAGEAELSDDNNLDD